MMKRIFLVFLLNTYLACFSQNIVNVTLLNSINIEDKTPIGFDNLDNYYFIENNIFSKEHDSQKWEYKNVALGKINTVDFLNPLKIVLFYGDFNTIVLLDNQLNEIQKIELFNTNTDFLISKIGIASQNQFWLFNTLNQQVILFDYLKNTTRVIGNPIEEGVKYIQTDFNNFYWVDKKNNLFGMDFFGKVTHITLLPAFDNIQIMDTEHLLYSNNNLLYCLNMTTKVTSQIEIVEKSFQKFYCKDQKLAIFTNQLITNYKIKLP